MSPKTGLVCKFLAAAALLAAPFVSVAATCTTQAEMSAQDRDLLSAVALHLSAAIAQQDYGTLQAALLPAEAGDWNGIRGAAQTTAPAPGRRQNAGEESVSARCFDADSARRHGVFLRG